MIAVTNMTPTPTLPLSGGGRTCRTAFLPLKGGGMWWGSASTPRRVNCYLQVYLKPVASSILRSTAHSFLYSIGMNLPSFLNSAASAEPSQGKPRTPPYLVQKNKVRD